MISRCPGALLVLLAALTAHPVSTFSRHFTLLRPGAPPQRQNFLRPPGAAPPVQLQQTVGRRRDSPTYVINLTSPAGMPGVGFIADPPVRDPFFTVNYPSNARPSAVYPLPSALQARLGRLEPDISWTKYRQSFRDSSLDDSTSGRVPASTRLLYNGGPSVLTRRQGRKLGFPFW